MNGLRLTLWLIAIAGIVCCLILRPWTLLASLSVASLLVSLALHFLLPVIQRRLLERQRRALIRCMEAGFLDGTGLTRRNGRDGRTE